MESETKNCQNCKNEFVIEPNDFGFYEKVKVPPPTFCPECRIMRRMTWRNERSLYKRKCNLCKKSIISIYREESPFVVFCHKCFRSDDWNPLDYGQKYDFKTSFFLQFNDLQKKVPRLYAMVTDCFNSEYVNGAAYNKNCYMIFASDHNEDCFYSHSIFYCKNVYDCLGMRYCELSSECIDCEKVSRCFYSQDCSESFDLYFSKNCVGCNDCLGCVNLRNKSYCIFNEQYSREEYKKKLEEIGLGKFLINNKLKESVSKFYLKFPVKYYHGKNNVNSTGDYLIHTKNSSYVFDGQDLEDCKYLYIVNKVKDSHDGYAIVENVEMNFEVISHNSSFSKFCLSYWSGSYGTYADTCENCSNVFGCIGLRNKSYCILNKQYTKEEYQELVPKIIKHMNDIPYIDKKGIIYKYGEFFPMDLSPFYYTETVAQEFFPSYDKEASLHESEKRHYNITLKPTELLDNMDKNICNEIIGCAHNGECNDQCITAFKITASEYQFYKKNNLPLPRLCFNCRHYERMRQRNPLKLWHQKCMKEGCKIEFETSYAPERPEIIYCEKCYQKEVY